MNLLSLAPVLAPLLGGGLLVATVRLRADRDQVIVDSAKSTVEAVTTAQALLLGENVRLRTQLEALQALVDAGRQAA